MLGKPNVMSQELYTNGSIYLIPIGERAINGFWVLSVTQQNAWQYEPVGTTFYDAIHQNIYRNHHDFEPLDFESLKHTLPEIPVTYEFKQVKWADNFPEVVFDMQIYPSLFDQLIKSTHGKFEFWIVLYEDRYESIFGDGVYYYYHKVFTNEASAEAYCREHTKDFVAYHLKKNEICIVEDKVDVKAAMPLNRPDNYDLNEVFRDLETMLCQKDEKK